MADGAVVLPAPTGEVLSQPPSPPPPLKLVLHLEKTYTPQILKLLRTCKNQKGSNRPSGSYLCVHEAVEHSNDKPLLEMQRHKVR